MKFALIGATVVAAGSFRNSRSGAGGYLRAGLEKKLSDFSQL